MLDNIVRELTRRYQEPHRFYHGLPHVEALLMLQFENKELISDQQAVMLAIWFHDAVYDTHRQDNEERSAELAAEMLARVRAPGRLIDSVQRKVRATATHEWTDGDQDTAVFLDLDLAVLASEPKAYSRYTGQIAREYGWVSFEAYRHGRARVLRGLLERPALYFTPKLRARWEAQARANMEHELSTLV